MENWSFYALFAGYALLLLADTWRPARRFDAQPWWKVRGALAFAMSYAVGAFAPYLWDEWLYAHQLFDASALGTVGGALAGFVVYEVIAYFWHRAMHRVPFLFRTLHQTHHSAERVDIWGAFYFHPLDIAGFTLLASVAMVLLCGVTLEAGLLAGLLINLSATLGHTNIRTPRWLGYLVARPEQHAVHHERGVHAYNYADLPILDLLFGTFRNPESWQGQAGYFDGASLRLPEMLVGIDVTTEPGRRSAADPLGAPGPAVEG